MQSLDQDPAIAGWLSRVDFFCGTSTGAGIALALAHGRGPADLVTLYGKEGRGIFQDLKKIASREIQELVAVLELLPGLKTHVETIKNLFVCRYDNQTLKSDLRALFGDVTLSALRPVAIPTFELDGGSGFWRPHVLHNFAGPDAAGTVTAVDAMLRSAAAPTIFPSHQGCIDGGVFATNPSLVALATALDPQLGHRSLDEVRLFSIGTGIVRQDLLCQGDVDWGIARWVRPLVSILVGGVQWMTAYQCQQILGSRYCRLDPVLGHPVAPDDWSSIPYLQEVAAEAVASEEYRTCREWIREHFLG